MAKKATEPEYESKLAIFASKPMFKTAIAAEFAWRARIFHEKTRDPMKIALWGLFSWGSVSRLIKSGEVIPNPGYTKAHKTIWCRPSQEFYDKHISPMMKLKIGEIAEIAGKN